MKRVDEDTIEAGPFMWVRQPRRQEKSRFEQDDETWLLVGSPDACLPRLVLKNYGGRPNERSGFSGWRLTSGGSLTGAGGWTSVEEAAEGVVPWLREYLLEHARQNVARATRLLCASHRFIEEVER